MEYLVGGTRWLFLLSNTSSKTGIKIENLCLPNDSIVVIHKTTTVSSTLGKSLQTTIQSEIEPKCTLSQTPCLQFVISTQDQLSQKFSVSGK